MTKKLTALVDGDVFVFRATLRAERPIEWDENTFTLSANLDEAYLHFENFIDYVRERTGATDVIVALSHEHNFRKMILPSYKHNRRDKRPPLLREKLKELVQVKYNCFIRPLLEGDDVLGILATSDKIVKGEKVVVSVDKDMRTIPCTYYSYDDKTTHTYSEIDADYNHLVQTLTGDTADGYTGCPGIGPKRADKLLSKSWGKMGFDRAEAWDTILRIFKNAGYDKDFALTQARVARICRVGDYDFKEKRPILWTPD